MSPLLALARLLLAWVFLRHGVDAFRHPEPRASTARWLLSSVRDVLPAMPADDVLLVQANAAVQVASAAMLALGRPRRLPALLLVASLVPTTVGGHAFWRQADPTSRNQQRIHFDKN